MQALIDQLFSADPRQADAARKALGKRGAVTAEDATAILRALPRAVTPVEGLYGGPTHDLLAAIQSCAGEGARAIFRRDGAQALIAAYPSFPRSDATFALKILALIGSREALAFIAERILDPNGPKDFFVSMALGAIKAQTPHADALFPALTPVLAFDDFRAIAVLDLANRLALGGALAAHPAAGHLEKLRRLIHSRVDEEASYAVSACLALAFVPGPEAEQLLHSADSHPSRDIRLEAAFALARRGHAGGEERLVEAARAPETSQRAVAYLEELGKSQLVPQEVREPSFAARAELLSWLAHPNEYGRYPEWIELWDRRTLYWPPTDDTRELFLFKFGYPTDDEGQAEVGVGLVGSITFSLGGDDRPSPEATPEDALAIHCAWELEWNEDPRAEGPKLEVGRRLLGFAAN